ncbi:hypothetical protein SAMN04515663_101206 [Alcanivorax sp. DSM 26293]|nr:hypothetical protein SAMN04515663_101206 [Alcanivorax sp. DSM 26293]
MANRVGVVRTRCYLDDLSSPEIPDRPAVNSVLRTVRPLEGNSYSGFVDIPVSGKLFDPS